MDPGSIEHELPLRSGAAVCPACHFRISAATIGLDAGWPARHGLRQTFGQSRRLGWFLWCRQRRDPRVRAARIFGGDDHCTVIGWANGISSTRRPARNSRQTGCTTSGEERQSHALDRRVLTATPARGGAGLTASVAGLRCSLVSRPAAALADHLQFDAAGACALPVCSARRRWCSCRCPARRSSPARRPPLRD